MLHFRRLVWFIASRLILLCIVLPAVLTLLFSELMRKLGWIRAGDLKLEM